MPDRNAALRNVIDGWDPSPPGPGWSVTTTPEVQPSHMAGTPTGRQDTPAGPRLSPATATVSQPSTPPCALPARGDVVSWLHRDRPQLGVVQNIGTDGRIWVRRLDLLDQRVPLNPDDLFIHHTATSLRAAAADFWLSVLQVTA